MPVGIERINAKEANPNDNIVFIGALKTEPDHDKALEIMKAVAAQFKPIMKNRHYAVTSLTEHEWNREFGGRNWNAGEIIELVLRRPDHSFAPYGWILSVMAHEASHCQEMNHSPAFHKVNREIKQELWDLRRKGYYGDGFWSAGTALTSGRTDRAYADSERPQVSCGGANYTRRASQKKRKVGQAFQHGRSLDGPAPGKKPPKPRAAAAAKAGRTGRQTAVGRAAGSRVQSKTAFRGEGRALSTDPGGSTFRRQANASGAVELRLAAAEAREEAARRQRRRQAREEGTGAGPKLASSPASEGKRSLEPVDLLSSSEEDGDDDDRDDLGVGPSSGRRLSGGAAQEDQKPVVHSEDEKDIKPFTAEELRYLQDEYDDWADDFLVVGGGAGSATVPAAGGKGKDKASGKANGKGVEVLTIDDSEEEGEEHGHGHESGVLCCGYDMAQAWAEYEAEVEAGLWDGF